MTGIRGDPADDPLSLAIDTDDPCLGIRVTLIRSSPGFHSWSLAL